MTMKTLHYLIISASLSLFISSCEDSFGIEKNFVKKLISQDTVLPPPPEDNKILISHIEYKFYEFYKVRPLGRDTLVAFMVPWYISSYTLKAELDTSKENWAVWMDLKFANSLSDRSYINRLDRVISLRIVIDSLSFNPSLNAPRIVHLLNGGLASGRWSQVMIRRVIQNDTLVYSDNTARVRISVNQSVELVKDEMENTVQKRFVEAMIWADFPKYHELQTFRLEGLVKFYPD